MVVLKSARVDGVWQELKTSDNVEQGNIVRVNGDGKAIISLDDGSAIRLGKDSRVKLTSLDPNSIEIANEAGEIYTRVVKADRSFMVKKLRMKHINRLARLIKR